MLKLLMFLAIVANTVLIVSSTDTSKSKVTHNSATSSKSSSSSNSHSSGYSSSKSSNENADGKSNKHPKKPSDECTHVNTHKKCKAYETYVECPDFSCEPKTCDGLGFPQTCPEQDSNTTACPGKPACLCVSGYVRNDCGVCVPKGQCPSCGGDPNAEAGCGIHCGRYCPNYKEKPIDCAKICKVNSCNCKPDYLFDNNIGKCVSPEDCTQSCGTNEVYSSCTNGGCFGAKTCSEIGKPVICVRIDPAYCKEGCVCQTDHVRNEDGVCIPQDQCPKNSTIICNNPNEVYDPCPPFCPAQKCSVDTRLIKCARFPNPGDPECEPSCRCIEGYLRDDKGVCIPKEECPPFCGQNEVSSDCINGGCYGARTCLEIGKPVICVKLKAGSCKKGCICQDGYLRNDDGLCVPEDQCPKNTTITCDNPNEVYDPCPATCPPQRCGVDPRVIKCRPNPELGDPRCEPGCRCIDGYLRTDEEVCVPEDKCPPKCGDNEIYSSCANGGCYGARNCSEIGRPVICVDLIEGACKGGCICEDKYLRNEDGICVPEEQCPNFNESCTGSNEYYDPCPPACYPKTCDEIDLKFKCPPGECKPACRCISDYYRNSQGMCVSEEECRASTCDNPNEVYDPCPATCPPQRCGVDLSLIDCAPNPELGDPRCEPGCRCIDGYLRTDEEVCVPEDKCPPKCGDNEIYSSCANGGCYGARNCSEIGRPVICVDLIEGACKGGCICEDKYLRNEDGICVPEEQCPNFNESCTGSNEYYDPCPPTCYPKTCDEIDLKFKCPPGECKPACRCISDYYRNSQGICVSEEECRTIKCTQPNEEYEPCPNDCPPQTCEAIGKVFPCPLVKSDCQGPGECKCKSGFFRNAIDECISKENCLKCCGSNEYYSCAGACDNVCATLNQQNQTNCPIVNKKCNEMCYCKEGYARDENNTCILIENCPKPTCESS